jgi:hypothetical protein
VTARRDAVDGGEALLPSKEAIIPGALLRHVIRPQHVLFTNQSFPGNQQRLAQFDKLRCRIPFTATCDRPFVIFDHFPHLTYVPKEPAE